MGVNSVNHLLKNGCFFSHFSDESPEVVEDQDISKVHGDDFADLRR